MQDTGQKIYLYNRKTFADVSFQVHPTQLRPLQILEVDTSSGTFVNLSYIID